MAGLGAVTRRWEASNSSRSSSSLGLMATTGADTLLDGLVLGSGFALSVRTGFLLAVALTIERVLLGISVGVPLQQGGTRMMRSVATVAGISALSPAGAVVGVWLLTGVNPQMLGVVLAFGAVVLMYLVTEELLIEAHEAPQSLWGPTILFVGFLSNLLVSALIGP